MLNYLLFWNFIIFNIFIFIFYLIKFNNYKRMVFVYLDTVRV